MSTPAAPAWQPRFLEFWPTVVVRRRLRDHAEPTAALVRREVAGLDPVEAEGAEGEREDGLEGLVHEPLTDVGLVEGVAEMSRLGCTAGHA